MPFNKSDFPQQVVIERNIKPRSTHVRHFRASRRSNEAIWLEEYQHAPEESKMELAGGAQQIKPVRPCPSRWNRIQPRGAPEHGHVMVFGVHFVHGAQNAGKKY